MENKTAQKNNKTSPRSLSSVLLRPRITEKATRLGEGNVYTFDVAKSANKALVLLAIEALYKVKPVRINITTVPSKNIIVRGRPGVKSGGKKAMVYLKKGEKIEFV